LRIELAELLEEARCVRINAAKALDRRLRTTVRVADEKRWVDQNRAAIEADNQRIASRGSLADEVAPLETAVIQLDGRPR
jgi:post-segregation antitoxin (ccd killing protein)